MLVEYEEVYDATSNKEGVYVDWVGVDKDLLIS